MIKREIVNKCEVMSDGQRVWVNDKHGCSIGRFTNWGTVDIHTSGTSQLRNGGHCLDCRNDLRGEAAWKHFVAGMYEHHGVVISDKHRPKRWRKVA